MVQEITENMSNEWMLLILYVWMFEMNSSEHLEPWKENALILTQIYRIYPRCYCPFKSSK